MTGDRRSGSFYRASAFNRMDLLDRNSCRSIFEKVTRHIICNSHNFQQKKFLFTFSRRGSAKFFLFQSIKMDSTPLIKMTIRTSNSREDLLRCDPKN